MESARGFGGLSGHRRTTAARYRENVIRLLMYLLGRKDPDTAHHCRQVMRLAVGYAEYWGYSYDAIRTLGTVALLHDVGKIFMTGRILKKPEPLDCEEYHRMKKHSVFSFYIAKYVILLKHEASIIRHHHERVDSRGYPDGLKGDEIEGMSKILSVCDAFDAMTSHRVYRKKRSAEEALAELRRSSGSQFDEDTTAHFCIYIRDRDAGQSPAAVRRDACTRETKTISIK